MKKRLLIALSVLGIVLIITNPTPTDFKQFGEFKENGRVYSARTGYYLFFSTYGYKRGSANKEYYGIMKSFISKPLWNFSEISDEEKAKMEFARQDSIKAAEDAMKAAEEAAAAAAAAAQR